MVSAHKQHTRACTQRTLTFITVFIAVLCAQSAELLEASQVLVVLLLRVSRWILLQFHAERAAIADSMSRWHVPTIDRSQ